MTPSPEPTFTFAPQPGQPDTSGAIITFLIVLGLVYILPSFIAILRQRNVAVTILLNFFLGWSLIGWIMAMVFAVEAKPAPVRFVYQPPIALDPEPEPPILSPDRRYWWDGYAWQPLPGIPPSPTP